MYRIEKEQLLCTIRPSPFGPFALLWEDQEEGPRVYRVLLSRPGSLASQVIRKSFPDIRSSTSIEIDKLAEQIRAFLRGENIRFSLENTRLDLCSTFQQNVLRAEHGIPRGSVSTYQRIAQYLGSRSSARAVGMALARNPFPIIVPCHRAIRADGRLGGYQGGPMMKRKLLEMEGITIDRTGNVTTRKYFY